MSSASFLGRSALGTAFVVAFAGRAYAADAPPAASVANPSTAPDSEVVDIAIHEATLPERRITVELNPLAFMTLGRLSANVIFAPVDHHALIISPFFAWVNTAPIYIFDPAGQPTQLPTQTFDVGGAEVGYRHYWGDRGTRGLFAGPSLILGYVRAQAQDGTVTPAFNFGIAGDIGYQVLVADRFSLSLGGGLQYTNAVTSSGRSIPAQEFPAEVYTNGGLRPRVLFSFGWAF